MGFMQTESVLQGKNRSGPAKNRFSVALLHILDKVNVCVTLIHYTNYDVHPSNNLEDISKITRP